MIFLVVYVIFIMISLVIFYLWFKRRDKRKLVYTNGLITLYERPNDDAKHYDEITVMFEGEERTLFDFTPFYDDDGNLLAAFKIKEDSPTALYWVENGGDALFHEFEEYVNKTYPEYELVDVKYAILKMDEVTQSREQVA